MVLFCIAWALKTCVRGLAIPQRSMWPLIYAPGMCTVGLILPTLQGTQQEWLHQLQWVWDQAPRPQSKILELLDSPEMRLIDTRESQSPIRPCGFGLTLPPEQNHPLGPLGGTRQHRHILKTGLATETHRPKPASAQTQRHIVCYP